MSSLWTPGGERPVGGEEPGGAQPASPSAPPPNVGAEEIGAESLSEEELQQRMAQVQRELVSVPASVVIANHCIGLFQLAAIHLEQRPPNLAEAQLAIDALAGVVESLGPRLGEDAAPLSEALASIRMGFVQVKAAVEGGGQPT